MRFIFTDQTRHVELRGKLGRLSQPHPDYRLEVIDLKYDRTPPPAPGLDKGWVQVTSVSGEAWEELIRQVVDRITPTTPGEGFYFRTLRDRTLLARTGATWRALSRCGRNSIQS